MSAAQYASTDTAASASQPISAAGRWQNLRRTSEFWTRAGNVYAKYKVSQVRNRTGTSAKSLDELQGKTKMEVCGRWATELG